MAIKYEHSYLFQHLKQTDETIKDNYSSSQYITVLDRLLYKSLKPIIAHTDFVDHYLCELVHLSVCNHRRKVTHLNREKFTSAVMIYLMSPRNKKFLLYKKMRLERNFSSLILTDFLNLTSRYEDFLIKSPTSDIDAVRKTQLENSVKFLKTKPLLPVVKEVSKYFSLYKTFKKQILEKYIRSIILAAQNHYSMNDSKMELDEIIQTMFVYSSHALDKYDQTKGTLTSYIAKWLQHARNQASVNELETSFLLPQSKRAHIKNSSVNIDSIVETPVSEDEPEADLDKVRHLAKIADPHGYARLSLDIQEYLTKEERKQQTM